MGCCQSPASAPVTASGRHGAGGAPAADSTTASATEAPVLLEVSAYERAQAELKRIFEGVLSRDGHASKAELTASLEKEQGLAPVLKEAGWNEILDFVNKVVGHEGEFVSWEDFLHCAEKTVVQVEKEVEKKVEVVAQVIVVELEAGEKALKLLKELFENLPADDEGNVSKEDLAAQLQKDTAAAHGEGIEALIGQAGYNPMWSMLEHLDTNKNGHVSWEEFKAHVSSAAKDVGEQVVILEEGVATQKCWGCC